MKKFLALIDASGSMNPSRANTISALNEYVHDLSKIDDLDCEIIFWNSDKYRTVYSGPVSKAPVLITNDYVCEAVTPLIDSISRGLTEIMNGDYDKMYVLIMTDGLENASEKYTIHQAIEIVDRFRRSGGKLDFIGCDIDAWKVGEKIGFARWETHSYSRGDEAKTYSGSSVRSVNYFTDSTFTSSGTLNMPDDDDGEK